MKGVPTTMKYMLMFCPTDEDKARSAAMTPEAMADLNGQVVQWLQRHKALSFARLQPPSTATTVRLRNGAAPVITDGPFVEAKESIGGFAVLEADDLDQALAIAKTWPPRGIVEIRPVLEPTQR
jgi:hypothetical protein